MSVFADAHKRAKDNRPFPPNICKFLKIWRDRDDKELYVQVMEEGIWLKDLETGQPEELRTTAAVLTDVLGVEITNNDVWKHRHDACHGCARIKAAGYELS